MLILILQHLDAPSIPRTPVILAIYLHGRTSRYAAGVHRVGSDRASRIRCFTPLIDCVHALLWQPEDFEVAVELAPAAEKAVTAAPGSAGDITMDPIDEVERHPRTG